MALDATKPTDQEAVSTHPGYIRENRGEINSLASGTSDVDQTTLNVAAGTTSLAVGTDLSDAKIEVINITADAAVQIATITLGTVGQIKIFVFGDNNVSLDNSITEVGGTFRLNQVPAVTDFDAADGDIIAFVNVGGNNGHWKELYRTLFVG